MNYQWLFADNSPVESNKAPSHSYLKSGFYNVKLKVTNDVNCLDSTTKMLTVYPMPTADFSINDTSQCLNENYFIFNDLSSNATNFNWYFGDGNTSNTRNIFHIYKTEGIQTVSFVVTTNFGCKIPQLNK